VCEHPSFPPFYVVADFSAIDSLIFPVHLIWLAARFVKVRVYSALVIQPAILPEERKHVYA
jgi:hypothetical protein